MRIGIVVEGKSEYVALPRLHEALSAQYPVTLLGPVLAPVHPTSDPGRIAQGCRNALLVLERRRVDRIVAILDREDCPCCVGSRSAEIAAALQARTAVPVEVVLKDRSFENWLLADLDAVRSQQAFAVSRGAARQVEPNKADHVDAYAWLQAASGGTYEKVTHAHKILKSASPQGIARNSRSFRRFLRVIDHPDYTGQSVRPA